MPQKQPPAKTAVSVADGLGVLMSTTGAGSGTARDAPATRCVNINPATTATNANAPMRRPRLLRITASVRSVVRPRDLRDWASVTSRQHDHHFVFDVPLPHHPKDHDHRNDDDGNEIVLITSDMAQRDHGGLAECPPEHRERERPCQTTDSAPDHVRTYWDARRTASDRQSEPQPERPSHSERRPP